MIIDGENVIKIGRKSEYAKIPSIAKYISDFACLNGAISILNIENTKIKIIGKYAFSNCHNLEEIILPSSLEEIRQGAFIHCIYLVNIIFHPDSNVKIIGPRAFYHCKSLQSIDFPSTLVAIGEEAFCKCKYLSEFYLVDMRVKHIGSNAFGNHRGHQVFFPSTITVASMLNNPFCTIYVDEEHPTFKIDECGYFVTNKTMLQYFSNKTNILIRRGIERIGEYCFLESKLVSITIPCSIIVICRSAFERCFSLMQIRFLRDSQLKEIKEKAFFFCDSVRKIKFPRSLRIIKEHAFDSCYCLEKVIFPRDSQLELIESPFQLTNIKHLSLPSSIRKIIDIQNGMDKLESVYIKNDLYESNEEGRVIMSKDGRNLVSVINRHEQFEIPKSVVVIKNGSFTGSNIGTKLVIPRTVEVIEEHAFEYCQCLKVIEFCAGSRLRSLGLNSLPSLDGLIINNKNFSTLNNGVVISHSPRGIIHVPKELTEIKIDPNVEVIFSYAFTNSNLAVLNFPKSLRRICSHSLCASNIETMLFEEGTEIDIIEENAFHCTSVGFIKFPLVKKKVFNSFGMNSTRIELPPNFDPEFIDPNIFKLIKRVRCPRSSIQSLKNIFLSKKFQLIEG